MTKLGWFLAGALAGAVAFVAWAVRTDGPDDTDMTPAEFDRRFDQAQWSWTTPENLSDTVSGWTCGACGLLVPFNTVHQCTGVTITQTSGGH